ncbi:MAG: hypothetical protein HC884_17550 [Chloroflexaceae bacterium]|nr:hypothetical protein [Chloroflexaceae bacterium]
MAQSLEQVYPHIARWTRDIGWIEIGYDHYGYSFIRALDEGGVVWEGDHAYPTLDQAMDALEEALSRWIEENDAGTWREENE